ncbi:hypothetical protein [Burkholderia pseudomallei]|uniref:hypothetical protein n=1 Tax=Burkholderia pseudomallei TaxID=28450 RepID=UPI0022EA1E79|nr:hypothetical protein [Burkholderia pseudomallei]CAJ4427508.1 Uncharacterised protein [Burkholderia pseudomallei]CAJ4731526.1 Uncharacterised protein [Burkholderia pseudomallei]CAJ8535473.1 Uncharacterised protein [Burkholderia pseudomallei]CAJ8841640.1 Uncharacterised protein [Burkholderia pseudomallei]CAK1568597.1 Uncharacterised protein [Burkholderia pseudomallei]
MTKRLYMMSPLEYEIFTQQCNPPALLVVQRGGEVCWNKFEGAEAFWTALGEVHDFDWQTVEPCDGLHVAYYRATPKEAS